RVGGASARTDERAHRHVLVHLDEALRRPELGLRRTCLAGPRTRIPRAPSEPCGSSSCDRMRAEPQQDDRTPKLGCRTSAAYGFDGSPFARLLSPSAVRTAEEFAAWPTYPSPYPSSPSLQLRPSPSKTSYRTRPSARAPRRLHSRPRSRLCASPGRAS